MRKPHVYICSCYSANRQEQRELNAVNSLVWADQIMAVGAVPEAPLLTHWWHGLSPKAHTVWLEHDAQKVVQTNVLVAVWSEKKGAWSTGQLYELGICVGAQIPVFYAEFKADWTMAEKLNILDAHSRTLDITLREWIHHWKDAYAVRLRQSSGDFNNRVSNVYLG